MAFNWRKLLGLGSRQGEEAGPAQAPSAGPGQRTYGVGDAIGGEYRVVRTFSGGMGHVYLVEHPKADLPLVLKTLQRPQDAAQRALFKREAETWVGLGRHPNLVAAQFVRELDGQLFVAAEYIAPPANPGNRGNTLEAYIQVERLPIGLVASWLAGFCDGMSHAQSRGLIAHRDIKPANLMVGPDGGLRITDFGLARSFSLPSGAVEGAVEQRNVAGTLPYMAPEQLTSPDDLDHRVDIYAIGITLYQLLSGSLPYFAARQEDLIQRILGARPAPLGGPFADLVGRCMARDRDRRFQSFQELREAAGKILRDHGLPPLPSPVATDDDLELLYTRALSYGALGRPDIALRHALEFAKRAPADDRAWIELGKQYLAQGRLEESIEASRRALSLSPFKSIARNNLGVALNRAGRHQEALGALETAASHDPLNTGALLNQLGPLMALRRPLQAITVLERASEIAPEKASIWANLGAVHLETNNLEEGERCLTRALELHPGLNEAEENLKTLRMRASQSRPTRPDPAHLLAQGQVREAEALLLQKVREQPHDVDAWHNLGIIAVQTRRPSEAIARFEEVVRLKPDEDFALGQLVRLKGGAGDFEGALRHSDQLAQFPKTRLKALLMRAQLLQGMGRADIAVGELRGVVQANPDLDEVWFMLSEILEREGGLAESAEAARRALDILMRSGGRAENIQMLKERIARLQRR